MVNMGAGFPGMQPVRLHRLHSASPKDRRLELLVALRQSTDCHQNALRSNPAMGEPNSRLITRIIAPVGPPGAAQTTGRAADCRRVRRRGRTRQAGSRRRPAEAAAQAAVARSAEVPLRVASRAACGPRKCELSEHWALLARARHCPALRPSLASWPAGTHPAHPLGEAQVVSQNRFQLIIFLGFSGTWEQQYRGCHRQHKEGLKAVQMALTWALVDYGQSIEGVMWSQGNT